MTVTTPNQNNKGFSEESAYRAALQAGEPKEEIVEAILDSLARQEVLTLGASLNSPIHKAMLRLTRRVMEFRDFLDQQEQTGTKERG